MKNKNDTAAVKLCFIKSVYKNKIILTFDKEKTHKIIISEIPCNLRMKKRCLIFALLRYPPTFAALLLNIAKMSIKVWVSLCLYMKRHF